jgi:broad specificity phosphatase PhoE
MTILALLRHGDTDWSLEKRIQGRTDRPLCESGMQKLEGLRLPREFGHYRILSSPLLRCRQTAEALHLSNIKEDPRLAEMNWGQWEGQLIHDLRAELGPAMEANENRGLDFHPPGGETPRKVLARVSTLLSDIAGSGQATLAISHKGVIRAVLAAATGWKMLGRAPVKLEWNAVHVFSLDHLGIPSVLRVNVSLESKAKRVLPA